MDAVITLLETISGKLELVSQDYRGIDALSLELSFFLKLFLRTRYVRRTQSSFLHDLFEELRHFYLMLREERRLEYVMVEEISRFRETLRIYQRRFCESNETCLLDFVLDKLRTMDDIDSDDVGKLKVELGLTKLLYYLCRRNQASDESQPFSRIICEIYEEATQFYFMSEDVNHEFVSSFRASLLRCCKQHFCELQPDSILAWSVWQLNEFHGSLLATLWDIYIWGQSFSTVNHFIRLLRTTITFLISFLRFAASRMKSPPTLRWVLVDFHETPFFSETFLMHFQVLAIDAARLVYMCWFDRDDEQVLHELQSKSCELLDKVRSGSGNIQATQLILTSMTSYDSAFEEYVVYLRNNLFHLVPVVPFDQMKGLATILNCMFLVNVFDEAGANAISHKFIEVIVVVFQLFMLSKKDKMPAELELRILQLLGTNTSPSTCINGISQFLGGPYHRILSKRYFRTPFLCLIVNGVVVSYDAWSTEQIKYQLLRDSMGLDLIALVSLVTEDSDRMAKLAGKVRRDSVIFNHFKIRARSYFHPMQPFDQKLMLCNILGSISLARSYSYAEMSEEYLGRVLYECLQGKRYLLVVENVRRSQAWRDIVAFLPKDGNGSKILLTSSTVSDPAYFLLEPASFNHQVMGKMGSCFKGS